MPENKSIINLLDSDDNSLGAVGSPSDTFEAVVDVLEISEKDKLLGELACFCVKEGDKDVFVLGQTTEITTENKWHQEPSFKGIIKRHGSLPNLSEVADNRIAKVSVQSSFILAEEKSEAHKLANSPSTGVPVKRVNNKIMEKLMEQYEGQLVCIGNAYDTDVQIPFWFKHFGKPEEGGGGDAYHIGVFGRTGSGKTTAAANMILAYARNNEHMSILILDPQEQFFEDNNVLPDQVSFMGSLEDAGMNYEKYIVPDEVSLPHLASLFSSLLLNYDFIRKAFRIHTQEKRELMAESIQEYVSGRMNNSRFSIGEDSDGLLNSMIKRFYESERYTENVYASGGSQLTRLRKRIGDLADESLEIDNETKEIWDYVCSLFKEDDKEKLDSIVDKVVSNPKNVIVLNISGRNAVSGMESVQTLFIKIIEDSIKEKGAELYSQGGKSNCLVVLDEAHRFISTYTYDEDMKELTTSIIDAVRTTRKYGIGYMFITQTIESLHREIREQIRIFAFGYGLTSGSEFSQIRNIINDESGAKFYRSFIDPSSNNKFPFMFYGPVSPLSFTGTPLFLEMQGLISNFPE
ncbi:MAG: DUF87 domain-containing protein [Candidatus Mycalebacterium zealandia]|nr:MAG: DUF87 domain-containing protein [Candidatus Mycalebacterium zealandia]